MKGREEDRTEEVMSEGLRRGRRRRRGAINKSEGVSYEYGEGGGRWWSAIKKVDGSYVGRQICPERSDFNPIEVENIRRVQETKPRQRAVGRTTHRPRYRILP